MTYFKVKLRILTFDEIYIFYTWLKYTYDRKKNHLNKKARITFIFLLNQIYKLYLKKINLYRKGHYFYVTIFSSQL